MPPGISPSIFRHSFISRVYYTAGLRPEEIGALVGHVGGGMVESTYLHLDEKETARKMEESGWLG